MPINFRSIFIAITMLLLLSGCQEEKTKVETKEQPKKELVSENTKESEETTAPQEKTSDILKDVLPIPQTIQEVVEYPVGNYANSEGNQASNLDVQKVLADFPKLDPNASEDELQRYIAALYSMYKMDYPDPKGIIETLNIQDPTNKEGPPSEQQKEEYNVEIILDSSGSMANLVGSKTRMDLAKEAIQKFTASLPDNANVALRVYGHKGTGSDADKNISCSSNELVYSLQPYEEGNFQASLSKFQPAGWTPLAGAIEKAEKDLSGKDNAKNIIYLVSDGIETCNGDPVKAAQSLKDSKVSSIVNIIGFDLDNEGQKQLEQVAKAADGSYTNVQNQEQLLQEFNRTVEDALEWLNWKSKAQLDNHANSAKQIMSILDIQNKWILTQPAEKNNVQFSLVYLANEKYITNEQLTTMNHMVDDFYKNHLDQINELSQKLLDLNEHNFKEMSQQIEEIYKEKAAKL